MASVVAEDRRLSDKGSPPPSQQNSILDNRHVWLQWIGKGK